MMTSYEFITAWLQARWTTDRGASLVEYALLVALIAVVCIIAITILGTAPRRSSPRSAQPRQNLRSPRRGWGGPALLLPASSLRKEASMTTCYTLVGGGRARRCVDDTAPAWSSTHCSSTLIVVVLRSERSPSSVHRRIDNAHEHGSQPSVAEAARRGPTGLADRRNHAMRHRPIDQPHRRWLPIRGPIE